MQDPETREEFRRVFDKIEKLERAQNEDRLSQIKMSGDITRISDAVENLKDSFSQASKETKSILQDQGQALSNNTTAIQKVLVIGLTIISIITLFSNVWPMVTK